MAIADTVRDLSELFASEVISAIQDCGIIRAEKLLRCGAAVPRARLFQTTPTSRRVLLRQRDRQFQDLVAVYLLQADLDLVDIDLHVLANDLEQLAPQ